MGLGKLVSPCMNEGDLPSGGEASARNAGWRLGAARHWSCQCEMASLCISERRWALVGGVGRRLGVWRARAAEMAFRHFTGFRPLMMGDQLMVVERGGSLLRKSARVFEKMARFGERSL